jgi:hypothetical protein
MKIKTRTTKNSEENREYTISGEQREKILLLEVKRRRTQSEKKQTHKPKRKKKD